MFFQSPKQDKANTIVQDVLARAEQDGLPLTPGIYSVLYAHFEGSHPDLSRQIEARDHNKEKLTAPLCQDLYEAYLSDSHEKAMVQDASRQLQSTMSDIAGLIADSGVAQREYQQRLIKKTDQLSDGKTDPSELKAMVQNLVEDTKRMLADNQKLEQKLNNSAIEMQEMRDNIQNLKREAMTDSLTGLSNRKAFDIELKHRASDVMDNGKALSLLMIDIDHFKQFNDTYGHQVGDQVLKLVSNALQSNVKPSEMVARYGGEEFSVILPGSKLRDAEKIAEKLREKIALKDIVNQAKQENMGRLSVSIGAAQLKPGESVALFIERTDRALYKAKELGRNTVVAMEYDPALHKSMIAGDVVIDVNR